MSEEIDAPDPPSGSPDTTPGEPGADTPVPLSADRARELLNEVGAAGGPEATPPAAAANTWTTGARTWFSVRRNQYIAAASGIALVALVIIIAASGGSTSGSSDVSSSNSGGGGVETPSTPTTTSGGSGNTTTVMAMDQDGDTATITFNISDGPMPASGSTIASQVSSNCSGVDVDRAAVVEVNANVESDIQTVRDRRTPDARRPLLHFATRVLPL